MKAFLAIVLSSVTLWVSAQGTQGYVTDSSGQIVKTGTNLCLRNGTWSPADAVKDCDPVTAKKAVAMAAPSDILFAFDSAEITEQGKKVLDSMAAGLSGKEKTVYVVGHTDRIGTLKYNQNLSALRAQAVSKYLSSKVTGPRFVAQGVASMKPTGKTKDCVGKNPTPELIACLAPDRRVVVTIDN